MVATFPHQHKMTLAISGFTVEISHNSQKVGFLTWLSLFHADWASLVPITVGWEMLHVDWLRPTWFPPSSWSNVYSPKPQGEAMGEAWGDTSVPTGLCKCLPKETIISVSAGAGSTSSERPSFLRAQHGAWRQRHKFKYSLIWTPFCPIRWYLRLGPVPWPPKTTVTAVRWLRVQILMFTRVEFCDPNFSLRIGLLETCSHGPLLKIWGRETWDKEVWD